MKTVHGKDWHITLIFQILTKADIQEQSRFGLCVRNTKLMWLKHWKALSERLRIRAVLPKQLWEQQEMRQRIISLIICKTFTMQPRAVPLRKWKRILWLSFIKMSWQIVWHIWWCQGLALIRTVILNLMISEMLLTSIRRKHSMHLDLLPVILQKWDWRKYLKQLLHSIVKIA